MEINHPAITEKQSDLNKIEFDGIFSKSENKMDNVKNSLEKKIAAMLINRKKSLMKL